MCLLFCVHGIDCFIMYAFSCYSSSFSIQFHGINKSYYHFRWAFPFILSSSPPPFLVLRIDNHWATMIVIDSF